MAFETKHEKYLDAIRKAALGEVSAAREAELRAHAAECEACREEYARAMELREMVDRGVGEVVAGEPSPEFAARLRARLADDPAPGRWRAAWVPVAAGACAVAGLLLVILLRVPRQGLAHQGASITPTLAAGNGHALDAQTKAKTEPQEEALATPERSSRVLRVRRIARVKRSARGSEPEVLVQPGQMEGLALFAEAIEKKEIDPKQLEAKREAEQKPIEIPPIEVKPISIPPIDFGKPPMPETAAPVSEPPLLPVAR